MSPGSRIDHSNDEDIVEAAYHKPWLKCFSTSKTTMTSLAADGWAAAVVCVK
jgi:hypothetical protein